MTVPERPFVWVSDLGIDWSGPCLRCGRMFTGPLRDPHICASCVLKVIAREERRFGRVMAKLLPRAVARFVKRG